MRQYRRYLVLAGASPAECLPIRWSLMHDAAAPAGAADGTQPAETPWQALVRHLAKNPARR